MISACVLLFACAGRALAQESAASVEMRKTLDSSLIWARVGMVATLGGWAVEFLTAAGMQTQTESGSSAYMIGSTVGGLGVMFGPSFSVSGYDGILRVAARDFPEMEFAPLLPAYITLYGGDAVMGLGSGLAFVGAMMGGLELLGWLGGGGDPELRARAETFLIVGLITGGVGLLSTNFAMFYSWINAESAHARLTAALENAPPQAY
jgi:hypothetical protein